MVKVPRPGEAKTRLSPPLDQRQAASLAECFIRDSIALAKKVERSLIIAYTPSDARSSLEPLVSVEAIWEQQQGGDLGARLENALVSAAARGYAPAIAIGTDSPTLPEDFIHSAFDDLESDRADLVLGGTEDGGYYMIGLRRPVAGLFQNVPWSTSEAYSRTLDNATRAGLRIIEARRWYDVDNGSDLRRLRKELYENEQARSRAKYTFQWFIKSKPLI